MAETKHTDKKETKHEHAHSHEGHDHAHHDHAGHDHSHEHGHDHEHGHAHEHPHEHTHAHTAAKTDKKEEAKAGEPKKETKPAKQVISKKDEATANGFSLPMSKRHGMYICTFIKHKSVDQALKELNEVIAYKRPVPMKGEIPHRSHPGVMSGRYPIKAAKQFVTMLKALRGNIIVNGMDLDKTRISWANANWASRPQRKGGMRFKRTHVVLKAREVEKKEKKK